MYREFFWDIGPNNADSNGHLDLRLAGAWPEKLQPCREPAPPEEEQICLQTERRKMNCKRAKE